MNGKLKAKTTIHCNTCGCTLKRTKTIKVAATNKDEATKEADNKIQVWITSPKGQNCKICESILTGT